MVLKFTDIDNGISSRELERFTQMYQMPHNKNFYKSGKENRENFTTKKKKKTSKKEHFTNEISYSASAPPPASLAGAPMGTATVVPPRPNVTLTANMITVAELELFGKLYTTSDTIDDNDEDAYDATAPAKTPELDADIGKDKGYRMPTDEDMICWLHKYFKQSGGKWASHTLESFTKVMTADGVIDSGRKNRSNKSLMIENSDYWNTIKGRAREYVELWLENDVDFASKNVPEPYCMVEPTLTDEQAEDEYLDEIAANPLKAIVGTEEPSAAEAEFAAPPPEDAPPPGCEPKWAYRKCTGDDKKTSKCQKLKGPERDACMETAEGCKSDKEWCVKRTGLDALMAFMRQWTNVKILYLLLILGPLILGMIFPPFAMLSSFGFMGAAGITPIVGYLHFYRLFGPGSTIFEILPYFIRWYFWYPMILLIANPGKLFSIIGKTLGKFFGKTIPNAFIQLFTKQIPKLVARIVTPIMSFVSMVFDAVADFFALIGKSIMGFFKVIAQFFENIGREIGIIFKNIIMKPINGLMKGFSGLEKFFADIGKAFGQISGIGKMLSRLFKKIGFR